MRRRDVAVCLPVLLLIVTLVAAPAAAAQAGGASPSASPAPPAAAAPPAIAELARRADAARDAGRLEEASDLYREALRLEPRWAAGLWSLGTIAYDRDRFTECRDVLARLTGLRPQSGPAWGIRGLCEFRLGQYAASARSLTTALERGPVGEEPIWRVVVYHRAILLIRAGAFELAIPWITQLAQARAGGEELVAACGLLLLRRAGLPEGVPPAEQPLVRLAGEAQCAALAGRRQEAESRFQDLLERHGNVPHVHYAHGLFLASTGSPAAIEAYEREIELRPDHVLARVELAFNLLTRGRPAEAVTAARSAVSLAPGLFAARLALGRALVETGDPVRGATELETAARLAPGVPEIQLALARAYAQAGRPNDAARANRRFQELETARRDRMARGQ